MNKYKFIFGTLFFFLICSSFSGPNTIYLENSYQNTSTTRCSNPLEDSTTTVGYNILTGTEEVEYYSMSPEGRSLQTIIPPVLGNYDESDVLQDEGSVISFVFPPDDRTKIMSTSSFPWSSICKLYITAADETRWIGSGAMIDSYHVLTAGHMVYQQENGGWVSQVEVIPGMRENSEPFGNAYATNMRTYSGWIQNEMEEHDWALLTLDRTIGNKTGWMGRMTADSSDPIYLGTLHTAGYPGDLDLGENMYYVSDEGEDVDEYNHWYWMDSAGGQSGSPVWVEINGSGYILSVHAYEYMGGADANFGTRLNQDKFDQLNAWLAADTPPVNKPNRLDPVTVIIIILITTIGIIAVVIIIRKVIRRSPSNLKIYQENSIGYTSRVESPETQRVKLEAFGFCHKCGRGFFRDTQSFCKSCGTMLLKKGSEQ